MNNALRLMLAPIDDMKKSAGAPDHTEASRNAETDPSASLEGGFQGFVENIPLIVWSTRADGHCDYRNRHWYEYTGMVRPSDEEMRAGPPGIGSEWLEYIHPDDRERARAAWGASVDTGITYNIEYRLRRRDGVYRWFLVRAMPSHDPQGRILRWFGTCTDINEAKSSQAALEQSQEHFRTLADNITQFAWMCDSTGWIFWYNQRWYEYTGTTYEEMKGWGWRSVHHPDHVDRVVVKVKRCFDTGVSWEDTFPLRGKDGTYRWFLSRAEPVRDEDGRVLRWFGTNTDITEQLETKRALEASERQARKAAERLRQANQHKDEFLAILAHELRNPLAPIRTGLELMRNHGDDQITLERARTIMERQTEQLVRLVDDLMQMSRISRGKLTLRREPVVAQDIVNHAAEVMGNALSNQGHTLEVEVPDQPIHLMGDRHRLIQVITNLLDNAGKYTPAGGDIRLSARRDGGHLSIAVSDTGIGIPKDKLGTVFEMFSQLGSKKHEDQPGLGIGLTLVKSLVEMHGGRVTVKSPGPGKGSTFTVRLPMDAEELEDTDEVAPVAPEPEVVQTRVLVVDDNHDAGDLLAMAIEGLGCEVRVARDGREACDAAAEFLPALVIMDIGMPRMNGYEAAEEMRASEWGKSTRLIALSGWGQDQDRRRAFEAGFDQHLVKPVDLGTLTRLIQETQDSR